MRGASSFPPSKGFIVQVALEEETELVSMAAVVHDLSDELTVICAYASLGGDVSYDVELTEGYFARIESAGKNAAQITRQLLVVDAAGPSGVRPTKPVASLAAQAADAATNDSRPVGSSFRQRLVAARG
jgi:hypothetical protein